MKSRLTPTFSVLLLALSGCQICFHGDGSPDEAHRAEDTPACRERADCAAGHSVRCVDDVMPSDGGDAGTWDAPSARVRAEERHVSNTARGAARVARTSPARTVAGGTGGALAAWGGERLVHLVLDVARFKYPPHWVPVAALWEAMRPPDPATGKPRGWVLLRRRPEGSTVLFRLDAFAPPLRAEVAVPREQFAALEQAYGEGVMQGCTSCG